MDDNKLKKLKELAILEDEKSLLLADKIDAVGEKVSDAKEEVKDAVAGLTEAIKAIPPVDIPEPVDYSGQLIDIMTEIKKPYKINITLKLE